MFKDFYLPLLPLKAKQKNTVCVFLVTDRP